MAIESVIDYFEKTVKPTVDEFLLTPTDIRRGRIAAIVLYHMWDYADQNGIGKPSNGLIDLEKMYYEVVRATANASKHFQLRKDEKFPHIAKKADQVIAEENEGLFCAPFGDGVVAESNEVYLLLDSPQTHYGETYEYVNLATAIKFVMAFWQQQIDIKLTLLEAR
ncbi:hypothetical protein [Pantoea piersonii]|uniref:hypothetical protein n=1 Tax=Pantoea piersonii TaxID=2364647 RepID=UPI00289D5E21|nr:hypothetical protein [Pantoea piersonii]